MDDWIYIDRNGTRELVTERIAAIPTVGDGKVGPKGKGYGVAFAVWGVIGITVCAKRPSRCPSASTVALGSRQASR
jgi:hypothetical protein